MSVITGFAVNIGTILNAWDQAGVFKYVLPFLLIFAIVFGILATSRILGENKGVMTVVALAVGLLALQFEIVPQFFATIFPIAGIGLAVLLVAMIIMGLAMPNFQSDKAIKWVFFGLATIIALIVIFNSFTLRIGSGFVWWNQYGQGLITLLVVVGIIAIIVAMTKMGEGGKK